MKRSYLPHLKKYLAKKILLISGPRQCGKTTLSKMLSPSFEYLSFDEENDRGVYRDKSWDRKKSLIIFDELHKKKNWKQWLKGIFDTEGIPPSLVVTGSARLDSFKKVGDSLAGRYFQYRLHPLDIRELHSLDKNLKIDPAIERLLAFGGFPEPYLEGTSEFYNLWKKTHLDIILRQDLLTQEDVKDIRSIELLIELLKTRVGSPLSYSSLAEDLQCSDKTVKKWLGILENMYVVFKLSPFHKNIARANTKQPKYYFYDNARVQGADGARLENLVATSLHKECQFRQDCLGENWELFYLSKKGGIEIDFLICRDGKPTFAVEVKSSDETPSRSFRVFENDLPATTQRLQLVKNLKREKTYPSGVEVRKLGDWLATW